MPRKSSRPAIQLDTKEVNEVTRIAKSRTEEARKVLRAKIILMNHEGKRDKDIKDTLGVDTNTVRLCLSKCLSLGVEAALSDMARSGAPAEIKQDEKAWIIFLACEKPQRFGFPHETWTLTILLEYIRSHAGERGFDNLKHLAKSKLWKILNEAEIKPHKVQYYLERRDPDFEKKMIQVLCVYKEINVALETNQKDTPIVTVSYDEKPGIQAIGNTVEDLRPEPYRYKGVGRDYEYVRHGTQSLLAGINLLTGEIIASVSDTHKSLDFIAFLDQVDQRYQDAEKIRVILDNHSAHVSKETMKHLETKPNRFEFVFTPKHGSWLNIIESFFSKLTRVFLRNLRVSSKEELRERLLQYITDINNDPVIFKWSYKMNEIIL